MAAKKLTITSDPPASPIEVWLRQDNLEVACTVVYKDETTEQLDVGSLSMRGAQREMTGALLRWGYEPVGRWEATAELPDETVESVRRFRFPSA